MSPTFIGTTWLLVAIATDVLSTIWMAKANGIQDVKSLIIGALLYIGSFIACVIALKYMQAGILYVLWAGIGAVATIALASAMLGQSVDKWAMIGCALIVAGLTLISMKSSIEI
ncbi:quaternary ammonium compound-resistance protein QacE [Acinetobacter phage Acj9]|uniref:Putative quaternary ammonium compound-resistance protein QacE n=1 Tax=Acinetobacter phage Acj9 TaxID=760939 RepID=E5EPE2_9CAUD|nr:quaternary ammonium compound-resistance protein QacE [Acinetobacter phage Acj9]ADG59908.1 putative quaternary ammonium compound-resistance protein QacE [Acinetobacter phage Acj9]